MKLLRVPLIRFVLALTPAFAQAEALVLTNRKTRRYAVSPLVLAVVLVIHFAAGALGGAEQNPAEQQWETLFDGQSLTNWKATNFGGEGRVYVADGQLILERGVMLTGITWAGGTLPRTNYEIALEAMRLEGNDFFCGLTFPVGDSYCSLIVGGWGGTVVGLSSLDGIDASENDTSRTMTFATGRWYDIRVQVTESKIQAWIDQEEVVNVPIQGREISIRVEVGPSIPLGIATWKTKAALRNLRLRKG